MKQVWRSFGAFAVCPILAVVAWLPSAARAQSCQTADELEDATRTAIAAAGQRYFDMAAKGDVVSMRQNAIPSLASDFSAIETAVKDHQPDLAGALASVKSTFLLDASGPAQNPHAEFYCGVFGKNGQTSGSAVFSLDNLQPGKYAVVLLDAASAKAGETMFSEVLQQIGSDWKLGGLYIKAAQVAGHDGDWFMAQARQYKAKGQLHNAWLFYLQARKMISPLPFMNTLATDKLYDESQTLQPADLPTNGKPVDLSAGTTTYKVTAVFPEVVGNDVDLSVRYDSADASNSSLAYQENVAVMTAIVAKYPEVRDAFAGVVARAVDASAHDYGTLRAMKDIK